MKIRFIFWLYKIMKLDNYSDLKFRSNKRQKSYKFCYMKFKRSLYGKNEICEEVKGKLYMEVFLIVFLKYKSFLKSLKYLGILQKNSKSYK